MGKDRRAGNRRPPASGAMGTAGAVLLAGTGAGLALTASAGASPSAAPARCAGSDPHLTVQGSGQGSGTPDVLTAVFGFSTTAGSSTAALSQNSAKVTLALQALADNGVAKADTQTTALNLSAQYAYPHGVPTLVGYQATETVTATLRHLATDGATVDAVVTATGNAAQVNGLTFSFGDPSVVQARARTAAVHQAVAHAQAMAAAAGRRLGAVCSLTDNTQPSNGPQHQVFGDNAARIERGGCATRAGDPARVGSGDDGLRARALSGSSSNGQRFCQLGARFSAKALRPLLGVLAAEDLARRSPTRSGRPPSCRWPGRAAPTPWSCGWRRDRWP